MQHNDVSKMLNNSAAVTEIQGGRAEQEDAYSYSAEIGTLLYSFYHKKRADISVLFQKTFDDIQKRHLANYKTVGCTACVATAWIDQSPSTKRLTVITSYLGDSESFAVITHEDGKVTTRRLISSLHNTKNPDEVDRINKKQPTNKPSLKQNDRINGEIGMTRGLGNTDYESAGYSHQSETIVFEIDLHPGDTAYLLIACDGLAEGFSDTCDIGNIIQNNHNKPLIEITNTLVKTSHDNGSVDNITALLMKIHEGTPQSGMVADGNGGDETNEKFHITGNSGLRAAQSACQHFYAALHENIIAAGIKNKNQNKPALKDILDLNNYIPEINAAVKNSFYDPRLPSWIEEMKSLIKKIKPLAVPNGLDKKKLADDEKVFNAYRTLLDTILSLKVIAQYNTITSSNEQIELNNLWMNLFDHLYKNYLGALKLNLEFFISDFHKTITNLDQDALSTIFRNAQSITTKTNHSITWDETTKALKLLNNKKLQIHNLGKIEIDSFEYDLTRIIALLTEAGFSKNELDSFPNSMWCILGAIEFSVSAQYNDQITTAIPQSPYYSLEMAAFLMPFVQLATTYVLIKAKPFLMENITNLTQLNNEIIEDSRIQSIAPNENKVSEIHHTQTMTQQKDQISEIHHTQTMTQKNNKNTILDFIKQHPYITAFLAICVIALIAVAVTAIVVASHGTALPALAMAATTLGGTKLGMTAGIIISGVLIGMGVAVVAALPKIAKTIKGLFKKISGAGKNSQNRPSDVKTNDTSRYSSSSKTITEHISNTTPPLNLFSQKKDLSAKTSTQTKEDQPTTPATLQARENPKSPESPETSSKNRNPF